MYSFYFNNLYDFYVKLRISRVLVLTVLLLVAYRSPAGAWKYEFDEWAMSRYFQVSGLCKQYLENLKSFRSSSPHMTCERRLNPKFSDFSKPDWEEIDPLQHLDVVKETYLQARDYYAMTQWAKEGGYQRKFRELHPDYPKTKSAQLPARLVWRHDRKEYLEKLWAKEGPRYLERIRKEVKQGKYRLSRSRFDIDNSGDPETVYRVGKRMCYAKALTKKEAGKLNAGVPWYDILKDENYGFRWSLYVLEKDNKRAAFRSVLRHFGSSDVFLYKGRVYIDAWSGNRYWRKINKLTVYTHQWVSAGYGGFAASPRCGFTYRPELGDIEYYLEPSK